MNLVISKKLKRKGAVLFSMQSSIRSHFFFERRNSFKMTSRLSCENLLKAVRLHIVVCFEIIEGLITYHSSRSSVWWIKWRCTCPMVIAYSHRSRQSGLSRQESEEARRRTYLTHSALPSFNNRFSLALATPTPYPYTSPAPIYPAVERNIIPIALASIFVSVGRFNVADLRVHQLYPAAASPMSFTLAWTRAHIIFGWMRLAVSTLLLDFWNLLRRSWRFINSQSSVNPVRTAREADRRPNMFA